MSFVYFRVCQLGSDNADTHVLKRYRSCLLLRAGHFVSKLAAWQ